MTDEPKRGRGKRQGHPFGREMGRALLVRQCVDKAMASDPKRVGALTRAVEATMRELHMSSRTVERALEMHKTYGAFLRKLQQLPPSMVKALMLAKGTKRIPPSKQ